MAISQGNTAHLEDWLGAGIIDAALSYGPARKPNISGHLIGREKLVLVSTREGSPMRADPLYVYFDAGPDFGRDHAAEFFDAGAARHSLGQASWALDHILDHGGSVYLPETLATPHVERGSLFLIGDAPAFARDVYLLINDIRLPNWPWLPDLATSIARRSGWGTDKSTHGERV